MHWVPVVDAGSCKSQKPSTQLAAYSTAETQHPKSQAMHSEQSSLKVLTVAMVLWKPEECDCRFGVLSSIGTLGNPRGTVSRKHANHSNADIPESSLNPNTLQRPKL